MIRIYRWMEERSSRLAIISGVVFALLALLWLSVTTRTALYYAEINKLEAARLDHIDRINEYWRLLGEESTPAKMSARAQALGYRAVAIEYELVSSPMITAGMSITASTGAQP
jgi:hypothetical protein